MKKRRLGNSDLEITPIGLGTRAICAGPGEFSLGGPEKGVKAICEGLEQGINWIDTQELQATGLAAGMVAEAVKNYLDHTYIFAQCDLNRDGNQIDHSLIADRIDFKCEQILRRLQIDRIDLYQIHGPFPEGGLETACAAMAKLQNEGKVRYFGLANCNIIHVERAMEIIPVTSVQIPYSLLARQAESDVLPFAQRNNIGVIACSPLYSGLLSGKMTSRRIARLPDNDRRKHNRNFEEPLLSHNLHIVELLREIGFQHGLTESEVAISWNLNNPAVTGSILNARRP